MLTTEDDPISLPSNFDQFITSFDFQRKQSRDLCLIGFSDNDAHVSNGETINIDGSLFEIVEQRKYYSEILNGVLNRVVIPKGEICIIKNL